MRFFTFLLLFFALHTVAQTNTVFSIHLGKYEADATKDDFNDLQDFGYIYGNSTKNGNAWEVIIGDYETKAQAEAALGGIEKKGYTAAFIERKVVNSGKIGYTIQIGSYPFEAVIDWKKLVKGGFLSTLVEKEQVKVLSGMYIDLAAAQNRLKTVKSLGLEDAFIRRINEAALHEVTLFETGELPSDIVVFFDEKHPVAVPTVYETTTAPPPVLVAKGAPTTAIDPNNYEKIKRVSVMDAQAILKFEQLYAGAIDGLFGKGTQIALEKFTTTNTEWNKSAKIAAVSAKNAPSIQKNNLQKAIFTLLSDTPAALKAFAATDHAMAKAYHAYLLYVSKERISDVNNLMNTAIQQAFGEYQGEVPFDNSASYAYNSLKQLVLHIYYIHQPTQTPFPAWMFETHEDLISELVAEGKMKYTPEILLETKDELLALPAMQVLNELSNASKKTSTAIAIAQQKRIGLCYLPKAIDEKTAKTLQAWHRALLTTRKKNQKTWQVAYLKSQILMENFYMDKGFSLEEAQVLALAVLQTVVL
jgi:hypothetical protein